MRTAILPVLLLMLTLLPGLALAQAQGSKGKRGPDPRSSQTMSHDERQRLRQDVDSARGNYQRRDPRRQDRMPAEERAKLRRDVQDANRDITRR